LVDPDHGPAGINQLEIVILVRFVLHPVLEVKRAGGSQRQNTVEERQQVEQDAGARDIHFVKPVRFFCVGNQRVFLAGTGKIVCPN